MTTTTILLITAAFGSGVVFGFSVFALLGASRGNTTEDNAETNN